MHSGDITSDLVAGWLWRLNMRPWTRNELCIVRPADRSRAHSRHDQRAAALRQIARTGRALWILKASAAANSCTPCGRAGGYEPRGDWVLKADTFPSLIFCNLPARTMPMSWSVNHPRADGQDACGRNGNSGQGRPGDAAAVHRHGIQSKKSRRSIMPARGRCPTFCFPTRCRISCSNLAARPTGRGRSSFRWKPI